MRSPVFFDANFAFSSESFQINVKNSPLDFTLSANHSESPDGVDMYWYSNCGEDWNGNSNSYFTFTLSWLFLRHEIYRENIENTKKILIYFIK